MKRRDTLSEDDLLKQLQSVPEVSLDGVPNTTQELVSVANRLRGSGLDYPGPVLLQTQRADLVGLPLRMGDDCHIGKEQAENLQVLSRRLRTQLEAAIPKDGVDVRPDPDRLRALLLGNQRGEWLTPHAIPALLQLLQAENKPVRLVLVELLSQIDDNRATQALAVRAMVDLSPEVREAAVRALKDRPPQDYQDFLLEGLQYPWQPVADHAAEALAVLQCRDSIPKLAQLLQQRETDAPTPVNVGRRRYGVLRELVRVNHLGNCLLCHAPSFGRADLVRAAVPTPGQPLPAPVTTPQYYDRGGGTFLRADITYLRQHFSVMHAVPNPGAWPSYQRFDYLVRVRPLTTQEVTLRTQAQTERRAFPQREVVLFALRELTGRDLGPAPESWKALLPPEQQQADAARLASDLVKAPLEQQEALLAKLRDSKGPTYTEALAGAIPHLGPEAKENARDALAARLTRMTAATLRDKLQDDNAEVRRAAAHACAMNRAKAHIPDLIPLLEDPEGAVARVAHAALMSLTKENFGPEPDASRLARQEAAARWLVWWKKQLGS